MTSSSDTSARSDRIVVAGLPRSGTTYVGKILEQHADIHMVLEPLNDEFGLRSVTGKFPFVGEDGSEMDVRSAKLLAQMVDLRGGWKRTIDREPRKVFGRRTAKTLIGSRTSLRWRRDRLLEIAGHRRIQCYKDPFATFALGYLAETYAIRSVCMVRHPGGYFSSFDAQPWTHSISALMNATAMRDELGAGIPESLWSDAETDKISYCALTWRLMSNMVAKLDTERVLIVRHEDLARDVASCSIDIAEHLGLAFTDPMRDYVERTSTGTAVAPERLKVRSFVRNSRQVADHWRSSIDPFVEARLQELVADSLYELYGEW